LHKSRTSRGYSLDSEKERSDQKHAQFQAIWTDCRRPIQPTTFFISFLARG
jgi:hypothetical protein